MDKAKILYVEDDESLGFLTADHLKEAGFTVEHCTEGQAGYSKFVKGEFDLCILDVMLPKKDGFTLAADIRKLNSQIPIIFLTAKSMLEDKLQGLKIGADDYITKPYSMEELMLKINIFLKRKLVNRPTEEVLTIGDFAFNHQNLTLSSPTESSKLTQREADLLLLLYKNKDQVLKREYILEQIWGKNDFFLGRSMDVFISRLRKYLKSDENVNIENVHGVGFKLSF